MKCPCVQLKFAFGSLACLVLAGVCSTQVGIARPQAALTGKEKPDGVVKFYDRTIDIEQHLNAFPYNKWRWVGSLVQGNLVFMHQTGGKQIVSAVNFGKGKKLLDQAKPVSDRDWSNSLTLGWQVRDADGAVFLKADENNNESFNIFHLDPKTKKAKKLTDVAYVTGFSLNPKETKLAYIERMGKEGARCRLHVLDLESGTDTVVAEDNAEWQFTWFNVSWQPKERGLVLTVLKKGDRSQGNFAYVALDKDAKKKAELLTDPAVARSFPEALEDWFNFDEVLVRSNENGVENVYRLNVHSGKQAQITDLSANVDFARVATIGKQRYLVVTVPGPLTTKIYKYDLAVEKPKAELVLEEPFTIAALDLTGNRLLVRKTSATMPILVEEIDLSEATATASPRVELAQKAIEQLIHSQAKAVLFDTHDDIKLVLQGKELRGKLHGMLYTPKKPLADGKKLAVVEAFYGGGNEFNTDFQIFCEAGLYVFSPAPRGSSLFSADFEKANDGDMGGNEILDIIHAGKYVSKELGIAPMRVGTFGHSHGGYATLRLLTFPGEVNGKKASFDWGFGLSKAGFASVYNQYAISNIKQWIVKEAGDPDKKGVREQWEDRSPINHLKHLKGKLLLIHGTADERVPYSESKKLHDKLAELGKGPQVKLVPIEGAGHNFTRNSDQIHIFRESFAFLEALP